jgi:hypothetical protein
MVLGQGGALMRERNELRFDCLPSRSLPSGSDCRDCAKSGVACNPTRAAEAGVQPSHTARPGRFTFRAAARAAVLLLLTLVMLGVPTRSSARVAIGVTVAFGPPALPHYAQPPCPAPGYIWTPGYWAWDPVYGYYWVPGTWVLPPFLGALWTPGYWAWSDADDVFFWNSGYWGLTVGFYGGIDYGYGYTGYGYEGGYWRHRTFYYNRAVNNISTTNVRNVYYRRVVNNVNVTRVSYNGGRGGLTARPTAAQLAAARQRRSGPVAGQERQIRIARGDPQERASVNRGRPRVAATPRPGVFKGRHVVMASRAGAPYRPGPRANSPNRETVRTAPARVPRPAHAERPSRVTMPRHAARPAPPRPPARVRREQMRSPGHDVRPPRAEPSRLHADRPPMAREAGPRAEGRRPTMPHPPEGRGSHQGHNPRGPHH